jgi:hypothetical protein
MAIPLRGTETHHPLEGQIILVVKVATLLYGYGFF